MLHNYDKVSGQARNAHVEEDALQHGARQELERRCQEESAAHQDVDEEVRQTIPGFLLRDL